MLNTYDAVKIFKKIISGVFIIEVNRTSGFRLFGKNREGYHFLVAKRHSQGE